MKTIQMIETFDKVKHNNVVDAKKHLEKLYGNIILKISHNILNMSFTDVSNYIDSNLDKFIELDKIKKDLELSN